MPRFSNQQVAKLFADIGDLLEIKGESRFKVLAYRRAAENLSNQGQDLFSMWEGGQDLTKIEGVGEAISEKMDELFRTGQLQFWEKLSAEIPPSLAEVLAIPDVGPRLARTLWEEMGITTVAGVKAAAEEGRLRSLPRLGAKTEARILANIAALERREVERVHLGVAWPLAMQIIAALKEAPGVARISEAGSLRRMRETIGDLDFVVAAEAPGPVMERFKSLPLVAEVLVTGEAKTSVRLSNGMRSDLLYVEPAHWGTALQHFTGSQLHAIQVRELVLKLGYSLNEYALTRASDGEQLLFDNEVDLYEFLGMSYIPPVMREAKGEVKAALAHQLPQLVQVEDIKGEVHCHSTWSDGRHSIEEMARAALAKGYEYLAITDHSQSLGVTGGLTPERLLEQRQEIDQVQAKVPGIRLWQGSEVEIKADGALDFPDEVLAKLDFVVASVHVGLRQDRETLTRRMLGAINNPHVKLIGHPSGRLLTRREGGDFDMEAVLQAAAQTGTALEVNASPERLDLDDDHVRRAIELGVKLIINCDAHHTNDFNSLHYGVATAGRGWATPQDILNTQPLAEFAALFKLNAE